MSDEKPYDATPQKLARAREKGEIARSQEVSVALAYAGLLATLLGAAGWAAARLRDMGGAVLQGAHVLGPAATRDGAIAFAIAGEGLVATAALMAPAAALVLVGLVATQSVVWAPARLAPKLSRISPLATAKQKFGPSGLFEFAKSALKIVVYGGLLGALMWARRDDVLSAGALGPAGVMALLVELLALFGGATLAVAAVIAAVDLPYQHHHHRTQNRMDRQELMDETKQAEGDPHLKGQRRRRAEEIATNRMLRDVGTATVVVTNPTHYAVALRWSPTDPTPPVCVAKGVDEVARRIREAAARHDVPICPDPATARALHAAVELGEPIRPEHFAAVATVIRFAMEVRERVAARGRGR